MCDCSFSSLNGWYRLLLVRINQTFHLAVRNMPFIYYVMHHSISIMTTIKFICIMIVSVCIKCTNRCNTYQWSIELSARLCFYHRLWRWWWRGDTEQQAQGTPSTETARQQEEGSHKETTARHGACTIWWFADSRAEETASQRLQSTCKTGTTMFVSIIVILILFAVVILILFAVGILILFAVYDELSKRFGIRNSKLWAT